MTFWNRVSCCALQAIAGGVASLLIAAPLHAQQPLPRTERSPAVPGVARTSPSGPRPGDREPPKTAHLDPLPAGKNLPAPGESYPSLQMTAEMEALLDKWEGVSARVKRVEGDFDRYCYNAVFQSESRSHGKFWHESPDKGRMDFAPVTEKELAQCPKNESGTPVNPQKKGPDDQPYEVKAEAAECWLCDGKCIRQVMTEPERAYHERNIPTQFRGEAIRNSPLPFLFGLKKQEAKERYILHLGSMNGKQLRGEKVPVIHIIASPLRSEDAREWSQAEVILHGDSFMPHSIRTIDPAGTTEQVYVFTRVDPSPRWGIRNPFEISLRSFKKIEESTDLDPAVSPAPGPGLK